MIYGDENIATNEGKATTADANNESDNDGDEGENPRNSLLNKPENGIELMWLKSAK